MSKIIRKIQRIGNASYAVVLPKEWVEELGLQKSDALVMELEGSRISIYPSQKQPEKEGPEHTIRVTANEMHTLVQRELISAYLLGATTIRVVSAERKMPSSLKEVLKELAKSLMIGIEVVEESLESITFQEIVTWPSMTLEGLIRRMHSIALSMINDSYSALISGDEDARLSVVSSDREVDRFYFYGLRVLNRALYNKGLMKEFGLERQVQVLISRSLMKSIERIADHAEDIALSASERLSEEGIREIRPLYESTSRIFSDVYEAILSKDRAKANEIIEAALKIRSMAGSVKAKYKMISEHYERIAEYTSDIAENVIDYSVSLELLSF